MRLGSILAAAIGLCGCVVDFPDAPPRVLDGRQDTGRPAASGALGDAQVGADAVGADAVGADAVGADAPPGDARTLDAAPTPPVDAHPTLTDAAADAHPTWPDAAPDAGQCTPGICTSIFSETGHAACVTTPVADCAPEPWDLCTCSTRRDPALFLDPPPGGGPLSGFMMVTQVVDHPSLALDGRCLGAAGVSCAARGRCNGARIFRWERLPAAALDTPRRLTLRADDADGACAAGEILLDLEAIW